MALLMRNYYSTVDDIISTFSDIEEDKNGFDAIRFRFERKMLPLMILQKENFHRTRYMNLMDFRIES